MNCRYIEVEYQVLVKFVVDMRYKFWEWDFTAEDLKCPEMSQHVRSVANYGMWRNQGTNQTKRGTHII